jgi:hypothetical protein
MPNTRRYQHRKVSCLVIFDSQSFRLWKLQN